MAKKAEAKAEASRPAEEEKVSPRKRKSEDVQPEQGAGGKGTTGDDGKDGKHAGWDRNFIRSRRS